MESTTPINHNALEQVRVISEVYEFLSTTKCIDLPSYKKLIKLLGAGMASRLRLTPDRTLRARVEHLYAVVSCASNITPLFEDQIILSFEGMSTFYNFDCDLVLEVSGKVILVDFTATLKPHIIAEKEEILQRKTMHPSLSGKNVNILVKGFEPVGFTVPNNTIVPDSVDDTPEGNSLKLIETVCNMGVASRNAFYSNCDEVLGYAINRILESELDIKAYSPPKSTTDKVNLAVSSVGSNNVVDTIRFFSSSFKKTYDPFLDALRKISAQSDDMKPPFIATSADLTSTKMDLEAILSELSDDLLARVLQSALVMKGCVSNVDRKGNITYTLGFDTSKSNKTILNPLSQTFISAKHVKGHYFEIIFSYEAMDKFMRRVYCDERSREMLPPKGAVVSMESVLSRISIEENKLNEISSTINKRVLQDSHSTVWDKVLSISRLARSDLGNVGTVATNLINSTAFSLSRTLGGALVSHYYEIVKTFSASIKNSHKNETYYVGVNGPYKSITITKMSATQDSFDRAHYCVISKFTGSDNGSAICSKPASVSGRVTRTKFRTFDTNDVAYNLRLPYYVISLLSWDIENSIVKGKIHTSEIPEKMTSSILHCLVNRDIFAQASQQVRYLYMSSIGYGATTPDIVKKFDFFYPRSTWEFVYMVRMIKMGLSLSIVRDNGAISRIMVDGDLAVCFPHSSKAITDFSQVVSSMYYCNIFNKFRAFHEVSEAFCFNELDEEHNIYTKSLKNNPDFHAGFSKITNSKRFDVKYLISPTFVKNEKDFVDELLDSGVGRFRFSLACVIAASKRKMTAPKELISAMFDSVNQSPIEACTMRGAMDDQKPTDKNQGVRAASAILEELIKQFGEDPKVLNNNAWLSNVFINKIIETGGDSSIYSLVVNQLCDDSVEYFYRIVQKDQVGNREISVLNAVFRIGALFVENLSKTLSSAIKDVDLLENPDKDYVFEKAIQKSLSNSKDKVICYDNSDQKRWGPNHLLNSFCGMFLGSLSEDTGIVKLILHVAAKVIRKKAKFPESLIVLFKKYSESKAHRITREGLDESHGSETLKTFYRNHSNDIFNNIYFALYPWGMCQGIFHATSSIYHAIMCKIVEDIVAVKYKGKVTMKSFCTSDDSSRIIHIDPDLNQVSVIKEIHAIIRKVGIIFNVIRNEAKSAFNFHVAEFNSIFFKKGRMATPTIKQRISKIDVGAGQNHVEDYMSALSSAANYFTIGGSYTGALTLSIVNIVLHTEQWNRWDLVSKPDQYFKPVELGGFPVIEPFSTCLTGAVSNMYLRSSSLVSEEEYARIFSTIITENPEEIRLSDYFRVPKSLSEDANSIKIFKNTGALGLYSLVRTDKKLSQFERRHGLSKWSLPESFLTLNKYSSDPKHFLYQIYKNGCMSLFAESEGVNSFYKRFTDPWVSRERKCIKISKKSILVILGMIPEFKYSYEDISSKLSEIKMEDSASILKSFKSKLGFSEFANTLVDQLTPRLNDSKNIVDFICSQGCAEYLKPLDNPATSRITLRGSGALDQEKYVADLLKILSGEKSRILISEIYRDYEMFDKLPTNKDCPNMDLKDSILVAENSVHAFDKYIKRNTKMITSGTPDTLASLVTQILRSRFLEQLGIRLTGSINLIGDRSYAFSYTSWYKKLSEKSQKYSQDFVNNSAKALYSDVVRYGIKATAPIITSKDHFEIMEYPDKPKRVIINAGSRTALSTFLKNWVSTIATFNFDFDGIKSFYDNKLLSHSEFRSGENSFIRCATDVYFKMKVNGLGVNHFIETKDTDDGVEYTHVIAIESNSRYAIVDIELTEYFKDTLWVQAMKDFCTNTTTIYTSTKYNLNTSGDSVIFTTVDLATTFSVEILPYTSTLALVGSSVIVPVCYANVKSIEELKAGNTFSHSDFRDAAILFSNVIGDYEDDKSISPTLVKALQYIMHRTNPSSKINKVNNTLTQMGTNFTFTGAKQLDLFKSLLLSEGYGSTTVNSSRLNQHVNNFFRSSPDRGSYLMATNLDDEIAYTLEDFVREGDEADKLEQMDYEDVGEAIDHQNAEAQLYEDSSSDSGSFDISVIDVDDIDFDAFSDDEAMQDGEQPFNALNIVDDTDFEEQVSIKSSRTGITVNPNQEFPYATYNYLRRWSRNNPIKRFVGCPKEIESSVDVIKLYLQTYQMSGSANSNILERLTGKRALTFPCPVSDLVVIKNTMT